MYGGKPIIGLTGGIGSGKSFVARLLGEMGCLVIDSDQQVRDAYRDPRVMATLREWWGEEVYATGASGVGEIDRAAVARKVFAAASERQRLERLLHPIVAEARARVMDQAAGDPQVLAFVWDTPLLFEAGLDHQCDAVVFVDAPADLRRDRVRQGRGWDEGELARREASQWPLDMKRQMSDDVVTNATDVDSIRRQVRQTLSRILHGTLRRAGLG